jgi:hypothetical protein
MKHEGQAHEHEGGSLGKRRPPRPLETHIVIHFRSSKSQLHTRPQNARYHNPVHASLIASEQQGRLAYS